MLQAPRLELVGPGAAAAVGQSREAGAEQEAPQEGSAQPHSAPGPGTSLRVPAPRNRQRTDFLNLGCCQEEAGLLLGARGHRGK